jgi:mannose-6-phosphate isomerase-like protein (cupin superfamily)
MIQPGETIYNRVTGEEMTPIETGQQTDGRYSRHRFRLPPHAKGVFLHIHTTFTEQFTVLEGRLNLIMGDPKTPLHLEAGESALVSIGMPHRFWNDSDAPVVFEVEVRPASRLTETLELLFALANAGQTKPNGAPSHLFDLAILGQLSESYLPGPPVWLQRAVFGMLAGIARLVGHRPKTQPIEQSF